MTTEKRWYGVSHGNGNDGVSQLYPDYAVMTDDPWTLAHGAMVASFQPRSAWRRLAIRDAYVDGETDYTVSACLHEGPNGETEFGAAPAIVEVFPMDDDAVADLEARKGRISLYRSLNAALGSDVLRLVRRK